MIRVAPVSSSEVKEGSLPKIRGFYSFAKARWQLPIVFKAERDGEVALVSISYRKTSSVAEIHHYYGEDVELLQAAVVGCVYQSLLEGRKRVECFAEHGESREAEIMSKVLTPDILFEAEGSHRVFTRMGNDIDLFGWIAHDGLPEIEGVEFSLADSEQVRKYAETNKKHQRPRKKGDKLGFWGEVLEPQRERIREIATIKPWSPEEGYLE